MKDHAPKSDNDKETTSEASPVHLSAPTDRHKQMLIVSKRLLFFVALSLGITGLMFLSSIFLKTRFMLSLYTVECGVLGGFVSIQQRLKKISTKELRYLSEGWAAIIIVPIFGGIFALVLYVLFLSELITSPMFPDFYVPPFDNTPNTKDYVIFFTETYPLAPSDFAKFTFWSFVAGFSERFVPQIIQKAVQEDSIPTIPDSGGNK